MDKVSLGTYECATIALGMYKEYLKKMQEPQFAIVPFDEFLEKVIGREKNNIDYDVISQ